MRVTTRTMNARAAAVSAALRRGGLNPLGSGMSRMREGIRVYRMSQSVGVNIDVDDPANASQLHAAARGILEAAGYQVVVPREGILAVRREGWDPC